MSLHLEEDKFDRNKLRVWIDLNLFFIHLTDALRPAAPIVAVLVRKTAIQIRTRYNVMKNQPVPIQISPATQSCTAAVSGWTPLLVSLFLYHF